ncbi:MAG: nucleoside hydrolase [Roseiflexaceae bacterium]
MQSFAYVLDVDTGEDDALAILLAVAYKLPLRAVLTSYGNTSLDQATVNTAAVLQLAGAVDVPVIQGCAAAIEPHPHADALLGAGDFVGRNGLCDVIIPEPTDIHIYTPPLDKLAETVCAVSLSPTQRIRYIVTGPCTNLAIILRQLGMRAPDLIEDVVIMGAAITVPGNSGPVGDDGFQHAEFNCYCDAVAFAEVLASGLPITLVSWDVTSNVTIPYADVLTFGSTNDVSAFVITLMRAFLERYGLAHQREFELNDPLTIWAITGSRRYRSISVRVVTEGLYYGATREENTGATVRYMEPLTDEDKTVAIGEILSRLGVSPYYGE